MWVVLVFLIVVGILAYRRSSALTWTLSLGILLGIYTVICQSAIVIWVLWPAFVAFALLLNVSALRKLVFTRPIFTAFSRALPKMSRTEKEALDAGTVWWDGDLFSGMPQWEKLYYILNLKAQFT